MSKADSPVQLVEKRNGGLRGYAEAIFFAILIVGFVQRYSLALVNRQANDHHHEVWQLLMQGFRSLDMHDCHECFHPKLFYVVCVIVFRVFDVISLDEQVMTAQRMNAIAGIATIWLLGKDLRSRMVERSSFLIVFALLALNSRIVAINGMHSNDSFAILFATSTLHFCWRFLRDNRSSALIWMWLSLVLAVLSKGSSWSAVIAVCMVLLTRAAVSSNERLKYFGVSVFTIIIALASVQYGDYDFHNYDVYANMGKDEQLFLVQQTKVGRPGVLSMADSLLTFRLASMLRDPMITQEDVATYRHRTSLWSQLYGRLHFVRYNNYPSTWETDDEATKNVGRMAILLGLPTLAAILVGVFLHTRNLVAGLRRKGINYLGRGEEYLPLLVAVGYTSFIILFSCNYRDFAAMKVIYILPGLWGYAMLFASGFEFAYRRAGKRLQATYVIWSIALVLTYTIDIRLLISQLK